jgi:hypothetical protein
MRALLAAVVAPTLLLPMLLAAPSTAAAAPRPGQKCTKVGVERTIEWSVLRCAKTKKGLRWRIVAQGPTYAFTEQGTFMSCAADPSAARIGEDVRVYYADSSEGPCPKEPNLPDSAVAPLSGGAGVPDSGRRISMSDSGPHKRILSVPGGGYVMFFTTPPRSTAPAGIGSATSEDGLNFTTVPGLRVAANDVPDTPALSPGDVVRTPDGKAWRMYFSTFNFGPRPPDTARERIYSALSTDLVSWTLEPGVRVGVGSAIPGSAEHPAVIRHGDGSVTALYGRPTPGDYGLHYSWSRDGLTFTTEKFLVESVLDSAFVLDANGEYAGFIGRRDNVAERSYIDRIRLSPQPAR